MKTPTLFSHVCKTLMFLTLTTLAIGIAFSAPPINASAVAKPAQNNALLQFMSAGHVVGFAPNAVYVAGGAHAYRVEFVGANATAPVADSASSNSTQTPPLGRVTYPNLWRGITLTYDAPGGALLRSTYRLEPFADPTAIQLRYNATAQVASDGTLALAYESGAMYESAPLGWQEQNGQRVAVTVAFQTLDASRVGFQVGAYNPALPLFIDPTLIWNTFLGGTGRDEAYGIAVDASRNVYVGGRTRATWGAGECTGCPLRAYSGGFSDGFVAKLDSSGNLLWNTFLGGTGVDSVNDLTIDGSGNIYVAGASDVTWGTPVRAISSMGDAFVAKLTTDGALTWNTFLGGSGTENGYGIAVDGSGNVYTSGTGNASWGAGECTSCPIRAFTVSGTKSDGFAAKLTSGGALTWNTFLGGSGADTGNGITVDGSGNVYVLGSSDATWGSPKRAFGATSPKYNEFVTELTSGGALTWNTFLGGTGNDGNPRGNSVAVDTSGNVYVVGYSQASWGSPVRAFTVSGTNRDGFAAKLDTDGVLTWNTFLGGTNDDYLYGIRLDASGNVYAAGSNSGTSWGTPIRPMPTWGGGVVVKLNNSGTLIWNTFMGGSDFSGEEATAIALNGNGMVWVAGSGYGTWGSPVRAFNSGGDAFVAQLPVENTYADTAGACASNKPCYTTFIGALNGVIPTGTVTYYPSTFNESVNITEGVTVNHAGGGDVTLGTLTQSAGTFNAPSTNTLSLTGNLSRSGGTFNHNSGTLAFAGSGTQTVSSSFTFNNLTVNGGATVDVGSNTLTVNGTSTNAGTIKRLAPAQNITLSTPFTFNDGIGQAAAIVNQTSGTAMGNTTVQVNAHTTTAHACGSKSLGGTPVLRYYDITRTGTGAITADLTLYYYTGASNSEANGVSTSNIALYHCDGTNWERLSGSYTTGTSGNYTWVKLTGYNFTGFSPFAIGGGPGAPTAVTLSTFNATSDAPGLGMLIAALCAAILAAIWFGLKLQKR